MQDSTNIFDGVSENCSVRMIVSIRTRFSRNPTVLNTAKMLMTLTVSASLRYKLNVDVTLFGWNDWLKYDVFEKFIIVYTQKGFAFQYLLI